MTQIRQNLGQVYDLAARVITGRKTFVTTKPPHSRTWVAKELRIRSAPDEQHRWNVYPIGKFHYAYEGEGGIYVTFNEMVRLMKQREEEIIEEFARNADYHPSKVDDYKPNFYRWRLLPFNHINRIK